MYIIHTSDLHIAPTKTIGTILEKYYYRVLDEIANIAIETSAKYILISGDLFDKGDTSPSLLVETVRVLRRLRDNGVRLIVVPGNHDNPRLSPNALNILSEAGIIYLLEYEEVAGWLVLKPRVFDDDKLLFYGIPGFRGLSSREVKYLKEGRVKFAKQGELRNYNVIIPAHLSTRFAGYDPSRFSWRYGSLYLDYEDFLRRLPENTIYIALGHIHLPLPLENEFQGNIAYPGAPIGYSREDYLETFELYKIGKRRRVLGIDISSSPPMIKSIQLSSSPLSHYLKLQASSIEEAKNEMNKAIGSIDTETFKIVLIDIHGIPRATSEILSFAKDLMRKHDIYIDIAIRRDHVIEPESPSFIRPLVTEETISELEEHILRAITEKDKKIPYDRLKYIIELLGSEDTPVEVAFKKLIKEFGSQDAPR